MTITKVRATRHNGRAGKNGVYTTKHNDRNFDLTHAGHIDPERTARNVYWDWENGFRTGDRNVNESEDGIVPSFEDAEKHFYEIRYAGYISGQNERNAKTRHTERNRTAEDIRHDKRFCPEETIFQFGREGTGAEADQLLEIVVEFLQVFQQRYRSNIHILDWALHMDETTVHIQERHCFDYVNAYGEIEPKQEKALEALGIPLADPEKSQGRYNNRKITFDAMNRLLLIEIAKKHGLDIEEQVKYGGKQHREKLDYIIAVQEEKLKEQAERITAQEAQITALSEELNARDKLIAQKDAELADKELKLEDVDALLSEVADIAYDKAVTTVAVAVASEAKKQSIEIVDKLIDASGKKKAGLKPPQQEAVRSFLSKARTRLSGLFVELVTSIQEKLMLPAMKKAAKEKIKERAKPSVLELLKPRLATDTHARRDDNVR